MFEAAIRPVVPAPHHTYELYLTNHQGETRFEPLTCAPTTDVHGQVRQLLADRDMASIEVRRGGEHQFTIGYVPPPAR